ncbi:MAG: ATP-binding protein [Spirochaetaceae bacterium]
MKQRSIFTTLFTIFLFIILTSIGASAIYSITTFSNLIYQMEEDELIEKTEIMHSLFPINSIKNRAIINNFTNSGLGKSTRITILDKNGKILSDSQQDYELMDNHINRPEIQLSISGKSQIVSRYSETLKQHMTYYALPIIKDSKIIGFIRTSASVELLKSRVRVVTITISIISLVIIILSIAICYTIAINFSVSINSVKRVANFYSKGKFNYSLSEEGTREMASLSNSINNMGQLLQDRFFTISKQKNRYKSMLESMIEPVIRMDNNFIIEEINRSAELIFGNKREYVKGKILTNFIDNSNIYEFCKSIIDGNPLLETIVDHNGSHLQIHGSILYDAEKTKIGILLVINDLTERVRLEHMRKEFVANVSHELRTPTTAIQGYIETLMNNEVSPEQNTKFLNILYSHSTRLNNIIDDLLVLAGLERDGASFIPESFPVLDLISSAINIVNSKAISKNIDIVVNSSEKHIIYAHPLLSEQALINLLSNAVNYSDPGSVVTVRTIFEKPDLIIEVEDNGQGIPKKDIEDIFERFFRVDRARSRNQGGSGLGLSIVKRVMNIHGGYASVLSEIDKGSIFSLRFPCRNNS